MFYRISFALPKIFLWVQVLYYRITLSLSLSFSLSMERFSPSSSKSINLTVSPDRVLNFFLKYINVSEENAYLYDTSWFICNFLKQICYKKTVYNWHARKWMPVLFFSAVQAQGFPCIQIMTHQLHYSFSLSLVTITLSVGIHRVTMMWPRTMWPHKFAGISYED